MNAAVNSEATTVVGNDAIASPKIAIIEMIEMSAAEDNRSQMVGRNPKK